MYHDVSCKANGKMVTFIMIYHDTSQCMTKGMVSKTASADPAHTRIRQVQEQENETSTNFQKSPLWEGDDEIMWEGSMNSICMGIWIKKQHSVKGPSIAQC